MTGAGLLRFLGQEGLTTSEVVMIVVGVPALLGFGSVLVDSLRERRFRGYTRQLLGFLLLLVFCGVILYTSVRTRYLLQGPCRYTVAQVTKHSRQRGELRFWYAYRVAAHEGLGYDWCGIRNGRDQPCPLVGTRLYLRFSVEDPSVKQLITMPVPDTLRTIPLLGWTRIP